MKNSMKCFLPKIVYFFEISGSYLKDIVPYQILGYFLFSAYEAELTADFDDSIKKAEHEEAILCK